MIFSFERDAICHKSMKLKIAISAETFDILQSDLHFKNRWNKSSSKLTSFSLNRKSILFPKFDVKIPNRDNFWQIFQRMETREFR